MTFTELLICILAVFAVMRTWFTGSIFATPRARFQTQDDWFAKLMLCPICLSVHAGLWIAFFWFVGPRVLVYVPAFAGAGWLVYHSVDDGRPKGETLTDDVKP